MYHHKSATVKVANYTLGHKKDNRNDLKLYHSKKSTERIEAIVQRTYHVIPPKEILPKICVAASASQMSNPSLPGPELMSAFVQSNRVEALLLNTTTSGWYEVTFCDVLLVLTPLYDFSKMQNDNLSLIKLVWVIGDIDKWYASDSLGAVDMILLPSTSARKYIEDSPRRHIVKCTYRCGKLFRNSMGHASVKTQIVPPAIGVNVVFRLPSPEADSAESVAYALACYDWSAASHLVSFDPPAKYHGQAFGQNWNSFSGTWKHKMSHRVSSSVRLSTGNPKIIIFNDDMLVHNSSVILECITSGILVFVYRNSER